MSLTLRELFTLQHELQVNSFGYDPCKLEGEELIEYIRWNVLATTDELHEALAESSWKPWASGTWVERSLMRKELVDAGHFWVNLCLTTASSPEEAADLVEAEYLRKRQVNARRQIDGYTGLNKCPGCHRDLDDPEVLHDGHNGDIFCSCGLVVARTGT